MKDQSRMSDLYDLKPYTQCHFFAGIGGWSYALRLAGISDRRPIWTGSCPCQPFSTAGFAGGFDDERHLWPHWFQLIGQQKPATILGEQVASKLGLQWLDLVSTDLESQDYAFGASDLCAASVGAPHIRQRVWFVADAMQPTGERRAGSVLGAQAPVGRARELIGHLSDGPANGSAARKLANSDGRHAGAEGLQRGREHGQRAQDGRFVRLGDADQPGSQGRRIGGDGSNERFIRPPGVAGELGDTDSERENPQPQISERPRVEPARSPWSDCDWLPCTDGKARPVEPGTFPLAYGIPGRVGRLRAYGNAIVPQIAAEFIKAALGVPTTNPVL